MDGREGKLRIGIITSRRAYPIIEEIAQRIERSEPVEFRIFPLDIAVISFASADVVKSIIMRRQDLISGLRECDLVLIPGNLEGDARRVQEVLGVPVYKAGSQPSSLPMVVKLILEKGELSPTEPADELLKLKEEELLRSTLTEAYRDFDEAFEIGGLRIPLRPPPILIAAETPVTLPPEELEEHAERLERSGADIVIAGIPWGEGFEESRRRIAAVERGLNKAILGVDSADPKILLEGASMGAELLLSLSIRSIDALRDARDKAFVVIPGDPAGGSVPRSGEEAASMLQRSISLAREKGFTKLIGDPILSPPGLGFAESVAAFKLSSQLLPGIPLFAGLSNVMELFDADSHGLLALLVQLLGEIGVSIMLTSEESWKARGSTLEARGASLLTSYSLKAKAPPHNAGIDLLFLKEKHPSTSFSPPEGVSVEDVDEEPPPEIQREVYFTIGVDRERRSIITCAHAGGKVMCFRGSSARALYKRILRKVDGISPEHAAYLGYELSRAELSLLLDKSYIQDEDQCKKLIDKKNDIMKLYEELRRMIKVE